MTYQEAPQPKSKSATRWPIIIASVLGLCVCVAIIGGVIMMSATPPTSAPNNAPPQVYSIGQDIIVGKVRWQVLAVENLGAELKSDNQFIDPLTTAGRFIRVRVEVENRATEPRIFTEGDIIDNQGRTFNDKSEAIRFIDDGERCVLESLNPNLPRICTAIYEIPAAATGLQLVVGDLAPFGDEANIDLAQ